MNAHTLSPIWQNWRSGIMVTGAFVLVWCALFFTAFMIAFGNETPASGAILPVIGIVLTFGNPLWGIPAAYLIGVFLFRH